MVSDTTAPGRADKRELLQTVTFGQRVAEEEIESLESYFVETDQWRRILAGDIDVVFGPKGSGKSAIYFLLLARENELFDRGIILTAAENPRGTPAFRDLVEDPPTSEGEFRALWKLYLLSLVGTQFREYEVTTPGSQRLVRELEAAGLLDETASLSGTIKSVLHYVRRWLMPASIEGGIQIDPTTGMPVGMVGKITLAEHSREQRTAGFISADQLFGIADEALGQQGLKLWLVLDRLDVAFAETRELEQNALRALFRVYVDNLGLENVCLKIFLRDDLWKRITEAGFREASHITRDITIQWNDQALMNLIIRRVLQNDALCQYYDVDQETVLASADAQEERFYRMFPDQVEPGLRRPATFKWMLTRTQDGFGRTAPRELIHLLEAVRTAQILTIEQGEELPPGEVLFSTAGVKSGLPEVSRVRLEQTLYAEYPELKARMEALDGGKTDQSVASLARLWRVNEHTARSVAQKLIEIGFFEQRADSFWVPFLYRDALNMVQGSAEIE